MKKFAIAIAALSLSAGAAFAENPNVSRTDVTPSGQPVVDQSTTASVARETSPAPLLGNHFDGAPNGRVLAGH
ncbi:MAG: hypothetical protein QHC90_11795 [Shinella sp.]|nr:hypothetical protein [Shinella sp.]